MPETIVAAGRSVLDEIRKSRAKRFALAAIVAFVAFWLKMLFLPDGQDDDWALSLYISGLYPDSGYTLFVNAALSGFVSGLFAVLPWGPNYYLILEILLSVIALMTIVYYSFGHLPNRGAIALTCAFLLFAVSICSHVLNFTGVTCMLLCAGLVVLFCQLFERRLSASASVVGIAFIVLASLVRLSAALLCLPFVLCLVAYAAVVYKGDIPSTAKLCAPLCIACVICVGFVVYNDVQWQQPAWSNWA